MKRGVAARRLVVLEELRVILSADLTAERMLRAVAGHLAAAGGDYCIADVIDKDGSLRRLEIAHADPSRRERLRVLADDTQLEPEGRIAALLRSGGSEVVTRVTRAAWARGYSDIVLLQGETFGSFMAAAVNVSGAPMAVLTVIACQVGRQFDADELAFLRVVAEWTGLGLENALRRELQPSASVAPPSGFQASEPATGRKRIVRSR